MIEFRDIAAFIDHLARLEPAAEIARHAGLAAGAHIVQTEAKREIGHYQGATGPFGEWPELADSTKAERVEAGFTENDPLLRTGELRDSIGVAFDGDHAAVGSDLDKAVDMELGTQHVPARSFLGGAAHRMEHRVVDAMASAVALALASKAPRNAAASFPDDDIPF